MKTIFKHVTVLALALGATAAQAFSFGDPTTPGLPGGYIGDSSSRIDTCYPINDGATEGTATVRWTFSYEYTRDSNGDGTNDSDPGWVVDTSSFSTFEWRTDGAPIGECG